MKTRMAEPENEKRWAMPELAIESVAAPTRNSEPSFLSVLHHRLRIASADGAPSEEFPYDEISRRAMDAVVVAAHFERDGEPWVYLRSALRPPVALADDRGRPALTDAGGQLWELPAGLVEPEETGGQGVVKAARRELEEELGFRCALSDFRTLGSPTLPCPGALSERQYFFSVLVDPTQRGTPTLDGSALERFGRIIAVPMEAALRRCTAGLLADAKTELGLRRLCEGLRNSRAASVPEAP